MCRDAVVRLHPCACALKRAELAANSETPPFGYTNQFPLPTDCLFIQQVYDYCPDEYVVESTGILIDASGPLYIRYVSNGIDSSQLDPLLAEAIAAYLAKELAVRLRESDIDRSRMDRDFLEKLSMAKSANGREQSRRHVDARLFVNSRYNGTRSR